jgi:primosomal protein N' (replication factor Y)
VILQTSQPEHLVIDLVKKQNFNEFLKVQLHERKLFNYPPFYRLIKVIVKHKSIETVARASEMLAAELRKNKALIVLGPEFPLISRIQLWYQKEIWLKIDRKHNSDLIKSFILKTVQETKQSPNNSNCIFNIDVDPF